MFRGSHEHAIDAKGRTSLPSRFRDALATTGENRIVLLPEAIQKFVRVYPLAEWSRQEALLVGDNDFNPMQAAVRRLALSECADCEVDKLGRVLIPASVRERAGLERDVIWIGVGRSIELWDRKRFQDMRDEMVNDPEKLQALVDHMAALRPR